jgi:hypothetical protein
MHWKLWGWACVISMLSFNGGRAMALGKTTQWIVLALINAVILAWKFLPP